MNFEQLEKANFLDRKPTVKFHEALFFCNVDSKVLAVNLETLETQPYQWAIGNLNCLPILKPLHELEHDLNYLYCDENNHVRMTFLCQRAMVVTITDELEKYARQGYDVFNWIQRGLALTESQFEKIKLERLIDARSIPGKIEHIAVVCREANDFHQFVRNQVLGQYGDRLRMGSQRRYVISRSHKDNDPSTTVYWCVMKMEHVEGRMFNGTRFLNNWYMIDEAEEIKAYLYNHVTDSELDASL